MEPFDRPSDTRTKPRVLAPELEPDVNCAAAIGVPVLISADDNVAEWLARLIHDRSDRKAESFVVFRPGRGDQLGLLKSVLNGSGPWRGTLFVADVSRATPDVQLFLRDMLGQPQPDPQAPFRVIAGTPVWLFEHVERGEFNDRLFYRLNKIHIRVGVRNDLARRSEEIPTDRPEPRTRDDGMDVEAFRRHRAALRAGTVGGSQVGAATS